MTEDKYRLKVHRRAIKEDTLNQLKWGLPIDKHLRVVFLGESAVDTGGPLQEFMHLRAVGAGPAGPAAAVPIFGQLTRAKMSREP